MDNTVTAKSVPLEHWKKNGFTRILAHNAAEKPKPEPKTDPKNKADPAADPKTDPKNKADPNPKPAIVLPDAQPGWCLTHSNCSLQA